MPLALALLLALGSIEIAGDSQCPDAASVRAELDRLGANNASGELHRLAITRSADAVSVDLRSTSGRVIGARSLPVGAACSDLASAVAVLIATWESELASDALPPAISFRAKRGYATVIAAGVLGAYGESSRGFGGALAVTAGREPSPWALGGSLGATVHEQQPLGRGKIGWFRVLLGLGGERRFRPGGVALALRGEAVGALLHASAHGYETNRSRSFASAGLAGGLRVDVGYAYVDLGGAAWLRREHLRIDGVAGDVELPRVELLLGVGVRAGGP